MSTGDSRTCETDGHCWGPLTIRAEKTCILCEVVMTAKQIALIPPRPRATNIRTRYKVYSPISGGMIMISTVYEDGRPVLGTRCKFEITLNQYRGLKELGVVDDD